MDAQQQRRYFRRVTSFWEERMRFDGSVHEYNWSGRLWHDITQPLIMTASGATAGGIMSAVYNALPFSDINITAGTIVGGVAGGLLGLILKSSEPDLVDRTAQRAMEQILTEQFPL